MIQAIRQKVRVKANGRLEILAAELQAGMEVEITVMLQPSEPDPLSDTQIPHQNTAERLRDAAQKYAQRSKTLSPIVLSDSSDEDLDKSDEDLDNKIGIEHKEAIDQAQKILRRFIPEGVSLVDELISERRAASELE